MSTTIRSNDSAHSFFKLERAVFLDICEAVNTPRSIACFMIAKSNTWSSYFELDALDTFSSTFADDYLVTELMRKNPNLPGFDPKDRERKSMDNWYASEAQCKITNDSIVSIAKGVLSYPEHVDTVIEKAKIIIANILGDLDSESLDFVVDNQRFGPGATSLNSGRNVLLSRKFSSRNEMSPGLVPFYRSLVPVVWENDIESLSIVSHNKVTFVPKTALIDRAISIEPHFNMFYQLGVGALLRRKLKGFGIDLNSQSDRNRYLASIAHINGLATIDLSSASDSISRNLVKMLLPDRWFHLLDIGRVEYSLVDGNMVRLEKFSGMGNGYTFELESLLFLALARACGDSKSVVFGDDIIIHASKASLLISVFGYLGFQTNTKKTFLAGNFFESCGTDWCSGRNVRPFYFKGNYHDYTSAVIHIANKIRIYSHRRNNYLSCDRRFLRPWIFCINRDRKAMETSIPLGYGDSGLIRNFDEATPSLSRGREHRDGWCGFRTKVWRHRPVISKNSLTKGCYYVALGYGTPQLTRNTEYIRGALTKGALGFQFVPNWPDLGAWL